MSQTFFLPGLRKETLHNYTIKQAIRRRMHLPKTVNRATESTLMMEDTTLVSPLDIHILSFPDTPEDNDGETRVSPGYDPENCPDSNKHTWCADLDGDSFGNKSENVFDCFPPQGEVNYTNKCNDCNDHPEQNEWGVSGADVYPGAPELCNLVDDDCDGQTDEGLLAKCSTICGKG